MAIPCFMYAGTFGTLKWPPSGNHGLRFTYSSRIIVVVGVFCLLQDSSRISSPWVSTGINPTVAYFALQLALNITVTALIVLRLLFIRSRTTRLLGVEFASHYTSVVAMVVESAALYTTFILLFLVPFIVNDPIQNVFVQVLGPMQVWFQNLQD